MMKRFCLGFLGVLALAAPALAETPSRTCLAEIQKANIRHRSVPADCWRMGPLHLGMARVQARTLLGPPGASEDVVISYRRRKYPVTRLYYVYPRNLRNWLRLAPARLSDFHPVILMLDFSKDSLVAVSVNANARITPPPCRPNAPGHSFVHRNPDFPYGLHGLTLGAPLASVETRFGKFANRDAAHDSFNYWPLPLSVQGSDKVSAIRFATGMAFANRGDMPEFRLQMDPRSCFITGYTLAPSH
jgi:hypothetical protein